MFSVQLIVVFSTFFEEFYAKIKTHVHTIGSGKENPSWSRRILIWWFSLGLAQTLKRYNNFVVHYPLLSMALTTGFLMWMFIEEFASSFFFFHQGTTMGLGSVISQTIIEHLGLLELDWSRIIRFAAFGYLFSVNRKQFFVRMNSNRYSRGHLFGIGIIF
jgi:hypothetical protein